MKTLIYASRHKDKKILNSSSTGGMFTALSDYFLDNGGAVVSAIYNYNTNQAEYQIYTDKTTRDMAKGSKYMQSMPLDVFRSAETWLRNNKGELLFVGMGCQADGFRKYVEIKGLKDRVTIVDIICHGAPSPKLWREYLGRKIDFVTFKDKREGWSKPTAIVIENGQEKSIEDYVKVFYSGCALRPSCYECLYAKIERKVDITIGDYWGIDIKIPEFYSQEGNALVLVHSEKGKMLWDSIKDNLEWIESNEKDCLQPNLIKPTEKSPLRKHFWKDYRRNGIDFVIQKYSKKPEVPTWRKILRKLKRKIKRS